MVDGDIIRDDLELLILCPTFSTQLTQNPDADSITSNQKVRNVTAFATGKFLFCEISLAEFR